MTMKFSNRFRIGILQFVREVFNVLLIFLNIFIPKDKNQWIFATHEGYPWGDNIRTVFERTRNIEFLKPIILCGDKATYERLLELYDGETVAVVRRYSIIGIWSYLRSRVCFVGYTNKDLYSMLFPHYGHIVVNLWHGVPIKAICMARPRFRNRHRKFLNPAYIHANITISNSAVDRLAMSACMMQNPNNVIVTGLPRNDILSTDFPLYADLAEEEYRLVQAKGTKKMVLYAPTFRDWSDSNNPFLDPNNTLKLTNFLAKSGYILGMRLHPMERNIKIPERSAIIDCSAQSFSNTQVVLRNTDILITDYSSIWVDFMMLGRPILGLCHDEAMYEGNQTFLYPFRDIFPGPIVVDINQLIEALEGFLQNNKRFDRDICIASNLLVNKLDGSATERVVSHVLKLTGKR